MKQHITRAYNSFQINSDRGVLSKRSKEERLSNEIEYYKALDPNSSIFFPRLLGSKKEGQDYVMDLEYYAYDNLGDYMVYSKFDLKLWENVVHSLNAMLFEFSKTKKEGDYTNLARAMYIDKTEKYYNDLVTNFKKFEKISKHEHIVINGKKYLNFKSIWNDVKALIEKELLSLSMMSVVHGDCCFSNILYGVNSKTETNIVRCIDPRGSFGKLGTYGDPLYDTAKLLHSYEGGYEYIIFDQFKLSENARLNQFEIKFSNNNKDYIKEVFDANSSFDLRRSRLIQGLIYIGMCSRHYDSETRQTVMYNQGVKFLNEALNE
tara:strand:+ start:10069 stop:11028 length:960 start_codon:yes stop_codon:yes gene_type:complete